MKILILTVAGMSTRFSQSLGKKCLKCIYYQSDITESLLYRMLHNPVDFDKYIIVGGYMYEELQKVIEEEFVEYREKVILVYNEKYAEYGSGYSLYKGLEAAVTFGFDEIVFAEGDLFVDSESFERIYESSQDVVTSNRETIFANKSVVFYLDAHDCIHYVYSTEHDMLMIDEPFAAIFNSGQIWKFRQPECIRNIYEKMREEDWKGTNLVFVQKYFQAIPREECQIIQFKKWINCNTIKDFEDYRCSIDKGSNV